MLLALVVMACVWGASIFIGTYWLKTPAVLISLLVNRQSESNVLVIIVNGTVVVRSVMLGDGNYRWSVNQDLSGKTYLLIQGADMFKKSFWIALCFLLLSHTSFAQEITSGYVMTHEHPTYGMAFGGNYAFAGAENNYKHGIMEKGYTAECGGCKVGGKCDHGEVKGSAVDFFGGLGKDMGLHGSHMGPLHNSFSHLRYSTEWIKDASIQIRRLRSEDSARMRIHGGLCC